MTARYEEVRRQVIERQTLGYRRGLAVLLHEGAAAWIEEWDRCATPAVVSEPPPPTEDGPAINQHDEVVRLLANMALDNLEREMRA